MSVINFTPPGPRAAAFMASNALVRCIRGPIGSGKSVTCAVEIFRRACQQEPDQRGIRPVRAIVVRQTNPELQTTTIKTWTDWFPEDQFGPMRRSVPFTHHIKQPLADKTLLDLEVIFLGLDQPEDVKKLLSAEPTMIWLNEAREMHKDIVDTAASRVSLDRYPSRRRVKPTWRGMIMDTNAPPEDHWWAIMSGDKVAPSWMPEADRLTLVRPKSWKFFTQPPGLIRLKDRSGRLTGYKPNPVAENVQNVGDYMPMIQGKSAQWISVYAMNEYGRIATGRSVYDGYIRALHVAEEPLAARPGEMLEIGIDFGLSPAAVAMQDWAGRVAVLWELCGTNIGAKRFARKLKSELARRFPDHYPDKVRLWGDPAGEHRSQADERMTPFQIFRSEGFLIRPAPTNDPLLRIEAVNRQLGMLVDGQPGMLVDGVNCLVLVAGFDGGYAYPARHHSIGFSAPTTDKVDKTNPYSHPHDALQASLLGMGIGRQVLGHGGGTTAPVVAKRRGSPFSRHAERHGRAGGHRWG